MINSAATVDTLESLHFNEEKLTLKTALESIDSSLPLATIIGTAVSVLAFAFMFATGMLLERALNFLQFSCPLEILAANYIAISLAVIAMTLRAGLRGDTLRALAFGSTGALLLGIVAALAGL